MGHPTIPDASPVPRWRQRIQYARSPLAYMDRAAQHCGDLFNAPVIGTHPIVIFASHPEAIRQIFASETTQITAPPNQLLQPIVGDHSMFSMEGVRHRRERKLLMPPFHGDRIRRYGHLICHLTAKVMHDIQPGETFTARNVAQEISLDIILQAVFGLSEGNRLDTLKPLLVRFSNCFQNPIVAGSLFFPALQRDFGPYSPWGYVQSLQQQIANILYSEIRDRRKGDIADKADILSLLLLARDDADQPMSDAELHGELITILMAGHETTASAVAWALYWTFRHPQVLQTLLEELDGIGPTADPYAIAQLPYLTAVCQEALRICPIAMLTFPREVIAPMQLMGHALDPGTQVYGCIYLAHRRPDLYPEPDRFRPERFLERQFTTYEFLPFGGGVRRCLGEVLALYEMKLVLATLLMGYDLALASQTPELPKRRGVTIAPAQGVRMTLKGLQSSS